MEATPVAHNAMEYRGFALAQLRILSDYCRRYKLNIASRKVELSNGVVVTCQVCYNKEDVFVSIPEVADVKRKQVVSVFTWFVSPLQQNDEGLQLPYHYPGETEGDAEDELPGTGLYDAEKNELNLRKDLMFGNRHFVSESKTAYSWNGPLSIYGVLSSPIKAKYVFSNGAIAREFGEDQIVLAYGYGQYEVALVATYKRNVHDELVIATYPPVLMVWKKAVPLTYAFTEGQLDGGPYFVSTGSKIMLASGGFIAYTVTTDTNGDDKLEVTVTKAVDTRQTYAATISRGGSTETVVAYDPLKYNQLFGAVGQLVVEYLTDISNSKTIGTGQNEITVDLPVKFQILAPRFFGALTAYQANIWRTCFNSDPSMVSTVQGMSFCADDGSGATIISEGISCSDYINDVVFPSSVDITTTTGCDGTSVNVSITQNGYSSTISIQKTGSGQTWVQTSYKSGPIAEMPEVEYAIAASRFGIPYGAFYAVYFKGVWLHDLPDPASPVPTCLVANIEAGNCSFARPPGGSDASSCTVYTYTNCSGTCNVSSVTTYEARCL